MSDGQTEGGAQPRELRAAEIRDVFDYWRNRLAPEWAVTLNLNDPPKPEYQGNAERSTDYLTAEIRLAPEWTQGFTGDNWAETVGWTDPLQRVETLVVHELLHLVFHDLQHLVERTHQHFSRQEWAMLKGEHEHHLERVIERMAFALVAERHGFHPIEGPSA